MLAQCIPEDLCDRDYTHTIFAMLQAIKLLGCEGDAIDLLEKRADQVLVDCGTFLTIISELTVELGGIQISAITNDLKSLYFTIPRLGVNVVKG